MATLSVQPPYPIFTDSDGTPLEDGYVWLGAANLSPLTNPISVYWDAALTQLAGQPVRTRGGYPANNGTPARLYVDSDYSILVQNKNGATLYSAQAATDRYSGAVVFFGAQNAVGDGATTVFPLTSNFSSIYINGIYQNKNTYSTAGNIVTFSEAPPINAVIEFLT